MRRALLVALLVALVGGGLGYAGWHMVRAREGQMCTACRRPVHAHSRTLAADGRDVHAFCCPACALSERQQSGQPYRIVELTDYDTGRPLDPAAAVLVRGSDVSPCTSHDARVGPDKQPMRELYDRCSPSLLAFATRPAALAFAHAHGGELVALADLRH